MEKRKTVRKLIPGIQSYIPYPVRSFPRFTTHNLNYKGLRIGPIT